MSLGCSNPEEPIESEYKFSVPVEFKEFPNLKEAPTCRFKSLVIVVLCWAPNLLNHLLY